MANIERHRLTKVLCTSIVLSVSTFMSTSLYGAQISDNGKPEAGVKLNLSVIHQGDSELDDSGSNRVAELQRNTWALDLSARMPINRQWSIGSSIKYENQEFDWTRLTQGQVATNFFDNDIAPWQSVKQYSASVSLNYRPNERWMLLLSPQIKYAYADTSRASDAQSYGAVFSAMRRFSAGNVLGLGLIYLNDLNEVKTVPYLAVRWQLSDNWLLSNPFKPGFSGPAGLELSYRFSPSLDVGFGASARRERFAVGAATGDNEQSIEIQEWLGFTRISWQVDPMVEVSAYGGYFFNGEMESSINDSRYDLAGQLATGINVSLSF
ncbi:autotransporter outer membrane beta-barrel domain-containing protein [Shewanella sp.]|uniref:autotransporter outer membrane beta-barrel domain-containing protein n=1 Tax=Shewanella sp. TaxID=50422 RepID=UPI004053FA8C